MKNKYIIFVILAFVSISVKSQFVVSTNLTNQQIADRITGNGVQVSNVISTCQEAARATFTGGSILGIDSGLVLSTGSLNFNLPQTSFNTLGTNGIQNHPLFNAVSGVNTNDGCIVQFDAVPQCDSLGIKFSFASEEYPDFVGGGVNDVFAFFVSGPNPAGGNYVNQNVAVVPGTAIPVSINTVNNGQAGGCPLVLPGPCQNCAYYYNNCGGSTFVYDGFTINLFASFDVVPGATYTFIIGIADGGDSGYDSAVFMEVGGLKCEDTLIVNPDYAYICQGDSVFITAEGSVSYQWTPNYNISSTTSNNIWVKPDTTTTYIVAATGGSSTIRYDSVTIYVTPQPTLSPIVSSTQLQNNIICAGDSAVLYLPFHTGGILRWMMSTTAGSYTQIATDTNMIVLSNIQTSTQIVAIQESNCDTLTEAITITVAPLPDFTVSPNDTICEGQSTNITVIGVQGNYTWTPTTGLTFPAAPLTSIVTASPAQTTFYTVKQTNSFGCSDSTIVTVAVVPYPILNAVPTDGVCGSNNGSIAANISSGTPPYMYVYNGGIGTVDNVLTGLGPGTYPVEVFDKHGCRVYDTVVVRDYIDIDAQLSWYSQNSFYSPGPPIEGSTPFEISFTNESTGTITNYVWYFGNGDTLTEIVPFNATTNHVTYNEDGTYSVVFIAYNNNPLCADTFVVEVQAIGTSAINTIPNVITPNGDGLNDQFEIELVNIIKINASIYNRWGKEVYTWDALDRPWRGLNIDGAELPPGTYFYTIVGEGVDGKKHEKSGFVQLLR